MRHHQNVVICEDVVFRGYIAVSVDRDCFVNIVYSLSCVFICFRRIKHSYVDRVEYAHNESIEKKNLSILKNNEIVLRVASGIVFN